MNDTPSRWIEGPPDPSTRSSRRCRLPLAQDDELRGSRHSMSRRRVRRGVAQDDGEVELQVSSCELRGVAVLRATMVRHFQYVSCSFFH